ncbi:MAG: hypothetical protein MZV63_20710 [Marinilabiliales bacterium]|nr:hypothetical protein [Marinilabiliales bacterium]
MTRNDFVNTFLTLVGAAYLIEHRVTRLGRTSRTDLFPATGCGPPA